MLWNALMTAVRHCPERLRLAFLEQPLFVPLDYGNLKIIAHSWEEYGMRAKSAAKEPETVKWIESLPDNGVLIDVGANVGTYSLIAAAAHPGLQILAIEPAAPSYASLCRNIVENGKCAQITPLQVALGAEDDSAAISYSSWQPGAALHQIRQAQFHHRTHAVNLCRLDTLCAYARIQPSHIKIDVDGAEREVLAGAQGILSRIHGLLIEISSRNRSIPAQMESFGLKVKSWANAGMGNVNMIFERAA